MSIYIVFRWDVIESYYPDIEDSRDLQIIYVSTTEPTPDESMILKSPSHTFFCVQLPVDTLLCNFIVMGNDIPSFDSKEIVWYIGYDVISQRKYKNMYRQKIQYYIGRGETKTPFGPELTTNI